MSKIGLAAVEPSASSEAGELQDATFASLEGHACTEASQALIEAVNEQVLSQLAQAEAGGAAKTNRKKLKSAIAAFLADLLSAKGKGVYPGNNTSFLLGGHDTVTGVNNIQYTAQFGNGVSATVGLDDPTVFNRTAVLNVLAGIVPATPSGAVR